MAVVLPQIAVYLGPNMRGAPDAIRIPLEATLGAYDHHLVASQQLADRTLVNHLLEAQQLEVLLESQYLVERQPVLKSELWTGGGDYEENRQCLLAVLRSAKRVCLDTVGTALQHANFVVSTVPRAIDIVFPQKVILTSANFAPGSLAKHFNWLAVLDSEAFAGCLTETFRAAMDGDFRNRSPNPLEVDRGISLAFGAQGEVLAELDRQLNKATTSIDLAYFNISKSSSIVATLETAARRGVTVRGVVDGDQHGLPWDAVPQLRTAGADVRYYPGQITGGLGRMHYKMVIIDERVLCLSTANISVGALTSLEVGLFIDVEGLADAHLILSAVRDEIRRLEVNAVGV